MMWKSIKDFENYEVSDTGLIRKGEKIIKPFNNRGYARIMLTNGDKKAKKLVHRLVAEHFIPTEDTSLQVNHKDMDKLNNSVINLEWVTCKENVAHAMANNPTKAKQLKEGMSTIGKEYGKQNGLSSAKPVVQLSLQNEAIEEFGSAREASRKLGISYKGISKCCNGKLKSYKGFIWKFKSK
jgi:hypothetical protein